MLHTGAAPQRDGRLNEGVQRMLIFGGWDGDEHRCDVVGDTMVLLVAFEGPSYINLEYV